MVLGAMRRDGVITGGRTLRHSARGIPRRPKADSEEVPGHGPSHRL